MKMLIILIAVFAYSYGKPLDNTEKDYWQPKDRSRQDWINCRGLSCAEWNEVERIRAQLSLVSATQGTKQSEKEPISQIQDFYSTHTEETPGMEELDDVLLTADDARELLDDQLNNQPIRVKRKVSGNLERRWTFPIQYKFDGAHSSEERAVVRTAVAVWERETCVRFREVEMSESVKENHLIFTKGGYGCASFIGRIDRNDYQPQDVNLDTKCFAKFGVILHEIGHALGLWHEHQRPNRDSHINVRLRRIPYFYRTNFDAWPASWNEDYGLPYDYNSVMHYGSKIGSLTGKVTMETKDPRYQQNLGQRVQLSFFDILAINKAYCQDKCQKSESIPCQNGGYQDPNDCSRCKCPEGLSGRFCEHAERSSCSDDIELRPGEVKVISAPRSGERYENNLRCNWKINAPSGTKIRVSFVDTFDVSCDSYQNLCFHWVEVKLRRDLRLPGPRFCCTNRPEDLITDGNVAVVTFRSLHNVRTPGQGFTAVLSVEGEPDIQEVTTTTTTTERPTTTTTTTRPTTTSSTTTTTTPKPTTTTTTTTTEKPTTTTSSTTTTKPTSTTKVTPTTTSSTSVPSNVGNKNEDKGWSDWTECHSQCKCGSCEMQMRYKLCNGQKCSSGEQEVRPCSTRVCTADDSEIIYAGKFYNRPCPVCCNGFVQDGTRCVPAK